MMADGRNSDADDIIGRLEALVSDCRAVDLDTVAYFVEAALTEARIQQRKGAFDVPPSAPEGSPRRLEER